MAIRFEDVKPVKAVKVKAHKPPKPLVSLQPVSLQAEKPAVSSQAASGQKSAVFQLRLAPETKAAAETRAAAEGCSMAAMILRLLTAHLGKAS